MTQNERNAAIWFSSDGFDPSMGLNGRRMVGSSFLRGFFKHADVNEFVALTQGLKAGQKFAQLAQAYGAPHPCRHVYFETIRDLPPTKTIFFSGPNFASEAWRRFSLGNASYSICGLTHTISSQEMMQAAFDLRASPQQAWDGIICTSTSARNAMLRQYDAVDAALTARFGSVPPRPQLPVIPLGINSREFDRDAKARTELRTKLNISKNDIVVVTLGRLVPYCKFDPIPLFMALQSAQTQLGQKVRLHLLSCGIYADKHSQTVFESGASQVMPDVSFFHHDGEDNAAPLQALSAGDIFAFPIDNFQETFGLAPIEAMATGLPVVSSDWNGMKDTVTEDVGFRIHTSMPVGRHMLPESWFYLNYPSKHAEYGSNTSALVQVDIPSMADAFVRLALDDDLRSRMGAAAKQRARRVYDWSVIVPQYQDFWSELNDIRLSSKAPPPKQMAINPTSLPASWQFQDYATEKLETGVGPCVALPGRGSATDMFAVRRYSDLQIRAFEPVNLLQQVLEEIRNKGEDGVHSHELARDIRIPPQRADRVFAWLLKYGFIEIKSN